MKMSLQSFLYDLKQIVVGSNRGPTNGSTLGAKPADGGFKRELRFDIQDVTLTSGTTVTTTDSGKIPVLSTASGSSPGIGRISFPITRDYDEASDVLVLRLFVKAGANDSGVTITGTATIQPIATGTPTDLAAKTATLPFQTGAAQPSTTETVLEISLSGNGLKRDDLVAVNLAYAGTTTVANLIYAVEVLYDSCIVSYRETDGVDDQTGNELR